MSKFLYEGSDWSFDKIDAVYDACSEIAHEELGANIYTNQLEIISSEQMLDAYSSVGLPVYYKHWSFGKQFTRESHNYRTGRSGLAYEIVINSDPCINYLMEENSMTTQAAVIAHAAFGHNHFFKNNYMFKEWTHADQIVDYLVFARNYIQKCEERYGEDRVERLLDSCHALSKYGVDKYKRPPKMSAAKEAARVMEREEYERLSVNDLWRTLPPAQRKEKEEKAFGHADWGEDDLVSHFPAEPEDNILYFIEKNSPSLAPWEKEIVRITRKISQYFYPQYQTKVMNEGWATFNHHYIMNRLYDKGLLSEGSMLEFFKMHAGVVAQFPYNSPYYSGFNPYALGFDIFTDIKRISTNPTDEDLNWFPEFAGKGNWLEVQLDAVANYRDESFIRQFLSPHLMRKYKLFSIHTEEEWDEYEVMNVNDESGMRNIRRVLANQYELPNFIPEIKVVDANMKGDRTLHLRHYMYNDHMLDEKSCDKVMHHVRRLWGYDCVIDEVTYEGLRASSRRYAK